MPGCGESFLTCFPILGLYAHTVVCYIHWLEGMASVHRLPAHFFFAIGPSLS